MSPDSVTRAIEIKPTAKLLLGSRLRTWSFKRDAKMFTPSGLLHHPGLAAPFRFLNELGQPAGVRVWGVEREPKIRE